MSLPINVRAQNPITVRRHIGNSDGKPMYQEVLAWALVVDFSRRDIEYFGSIKNGKIFVVIPPPVLRLADQIVFNGKSYDIAQIKTCRNLDNNVIAYRVAVVV